MQAQNVGLGVVFAILFQASAGREGTELWTNVLKRTSDRIKLLNSGNRAEQSKFQSASKVNVHQRLEPG
jgi:hypothetical protein